MQELHLVGFTTDRRHLIFSSRQGTKSGSFLVPVDEELLDAVEGLSADTADREDAGEDFDEEVVAPAAEPRVDAKLSVREVQARLRAGVAVEEIAARAEVDPAWVERFAPPIRAEQQQIVTRALGARMERSRAGKSALTLRDAVSRSMAERDLTFTAESFASAWSSRLVGADLWSIEFTFSHRGRRRTVSWTYEAGGGTLTTSDRLASQIGFVAGEAPSRTETRRSSTEGGDRSSSDGGGRAPARRPAAKRKPAAKKKAAKKKAAKKTSVAKTKSAAKKSAAKRKPAKKKATGARKRTGARKKALPTATRVAAARKDATERLEQATAKRVAAARKAAQRKSASAQKDAERRVAAEEKAAARVAREAEAQRRADEEAEAESSAAKDREAARAVAAAERQLAEERSSAARDGAERAAAAPPAVAPDDTSGADDDTPSVAVDAEPARTIRPVERHPDQAVVRLRAPQPSVPAEDPAARVAARRARAAERSVSTAQFRSGSAVQAASTPVNGAGAAVPEGVRRRDPREREAPAGGGVGRPRPDGRRTRTRQLRAR